MVSILAELQLPWGDGLVIQTYGVALYLAAIMSFLIFLRIQSRYFVKNILAGQMIISYIIFFLTSYFVYKYFWGTHKFIKNAPEYGFHFISGFMAVLIYMAIYKRLYKSVPFLLDTFVISIMPSLFIVAIGAFLSGTDFGAPTLTPFGINLFQNPICLDITGMVHPVQLYYAFNILVLYLVLYFSRRFSHRPGFKFIIFFISYFIFSFITEFFRGDIEKSFYGLTLGQLLQAIILLVLAPLSIFIRLKLEDSKYALTTSSKKYLFPGIKIKNIFLFRARKLKDLYCNIKIYIFMIIFLPLITVPGHYWKNRPIEIDRPYIIEDDTERIYINIPSYTLYFKGNEYKISPGRKYMQTPIGAGIVEQKRKRIMFVYTAGWRKGEKVEFGHSVDGEVIKVPYDKMRGLGLKIKDYTDYVIHSTTEDWNIGKAASSGCIRMRIIDMLKLYPAVKVNTPVIIDYMLVVLRGNKLIFYEDVYDLRTCIIEGKYVDTFKYAFNIVQRRTGRILSYAKYDKVLKNAKYVNNRMIVPLIYLIE